MPHDVVIMGVYFPPLLVAGLGGLLAATFTAHYLNRSGLVQHISSPPLAFLAMTAIYTVLLGSTVVRI
jgi:hypothetical protein